jgi:hypothetical protein
MGVARRKKDCADNIFYRYVVSKNENAGVLLKRFWEINIGDI